MKKFIIKGLAALLPAMTLLSCSKGFLNIVPIGKQTAQTANDYNLLLNSPNFYMYGSGGGWQEMAIMGDDVAAENPLLPTTYPQTLWAFQWRDSIWRQTDPIRISTPPTSPIHQP